jgi:membrane protease YdiL (CAAX protease family)
VERVLPGANGTALTQAGLPPAPAAPAARPVATKGRLAGWLVFVGTLATLNYAGNLAGSDNGPSADFVYQWSAALLGTVQVVIMIGIALWIATGTSLRAMFALRRPASWRRALGLAFGLFVLALVLAAALEPLLPAGEEQGLTPDGWDGDRAAQFAASFVVIAGLVPVAEELVFRGLGHTLLAAYLGIRPAVLANGVLFAVAHGLILGLPVLILFGCALAYVRERTGSIYPCIVTHAFFNGFALIAAVALGENEGS